MRLLIALLVAAVLVACVINVMYGRYSMTADDRIRERYGIPPDTPIRPWRTVVIHHSATQTGNAERFDRYHREHKHMENGLAYHFVIGNGSLSGDGEIEVSKRWIKQLGGGHVDRETINELGIGIGLVGDFTKTTATPAQMDALLKLLSELQSEFNIPAERVFGHCEINRKPTICPGPNFSMDELRARLRGRPQVSSLNK